MLKERPDFYLMTTQALFDWVERHDIYKGESICGTDFTYIEELMEYEDDTSKQQEAFDELMEFAETIWEERYA